LPTPGIAYLTRALRLSAGIVVSASHNPFDDNGIKFFSAAGAKLPDEVESTIERMMDMPLACVASADLGKARRIDDAAGRYIEFCKSTFPNERDLRGCKIVVDCANGAAYHVAPQVFEELGAEVIALGVTPDGRNINDRCGAVHPEAMAAEVRKHGAAIGIALDGDADRVILADEKGRIVDGDQIMALLGTRFIAAGTLPHKTVVATVMSNLGLERALTARGGRLLRTAVGDRYVVEAMREQGLTFGGEQSGHLVFLDHATTGDGTVAALRVLAVMLEEGCPLSQLAEESMIRYPQVLLNFAVAEKRPLEDLPEILKLITRVEGELGADGRVLVRYSGTEAKARVMIEGTSEERIRAYAEDIASALRKALAR